MGYGPEASRRFTWIVEEWAKQFKVNVNRSKSGVIILGRKDDDGKV